MPNAFLEDFVDATKQPTSHGWSESVYACTDFPDAEEGEIKETKAALNWAEVICHVPKTQTTDWSVIVKGMFNALAPGRGLVASFRYTYPDDGNRRGGHAVALFQSHHGSRYTHFCDPSRVIVSGTEAEVLEYINKRWLPNFSSKRKADAYRVMELKQ
eukprot:TRINITY_DN76593_c0_g1_i1.p1 TRINITY_DN76593_c0_g1~~TRINITY_DN76593_c0_g1_i1.p1  ORF type:complete len:158 (+),score=19.62 TRINITY_DN76593_c0_g1_i1:141-614(+)